MLGFFIWLITFPSLLFHLLSIGVILALIIGYKLYKLLKNQSSNHNTRLMDKAKLIIMRRRFGNRTMNYASHLSLAILLIGLSSHGALSLEQDARMMEPFNKMMRSAIDLVTLGNMPEISVSPMELGRSMSLLAYKTTIRRPQGVPQNATALFRRVQDEVYQADLSKVTRKSMLELHDDLHKIMDSVMENIRTSPDGVFTNHLEARVGDKTLEEALVDFGLQMRATGTDLMSYRDLAHKLMGIPGLPTFSHSVNSVTDMAAPTFGTVTDFTSNMVKVPVQQAQGLASNSFSWISNNIRPGSTPIAAN